MTSLRDVLPPVVTNMDFGSDYYRRWLHVNSGEDLPFPWSLYFPPLTDDDSRFWMRVNRHVDGRYYELVYLRN